MPDLSTVRTPKRRSVFVRAARIAFTFVTLNVAAVQALFAAAFDREVWKK